MKVPEIEFDWDEANIGHVARHSVLPKEAEQVILNDPVDVGMEIVEGEERYLNLGATVHGRAIKRLIQFYQDLRKAPPFRHGDIRRFAASAGREFACIRQRHAA